MNGICKCLTALFTFEKGCMRSPQGTSLLRPSEITYYIVHTFQNMDDFKVRIWFWALYYDSFSLLGTPMVEYVLQMLYLNSYSHMKFELLYSLCMPKIQIVAAMNAKLHISPQSEQNFLPTQTLVICKIVHWAHYQFSRQLIYMAASTSAI